MSSSSSVVRVGLSRGAPRGRVGVLLAAVLFCLGATVIAAPAASAASSDIRVHFTNNSDSVLNWSRSTLEHGCWVDKPPAKIEIGQTVDIASESCGFATGTQIEVLYEVQRTHGTIVLQYENPFSGEDEFREQAPQGYVFETSGVIENRTAKFGCFSATCDGIADEWKRNGLLMDPGDGSPLAFVDLPKMGLAWDRPNILVQLDWMEEDRTDGQPNRNQQLDQPAIDAVIKAFDEAPITYRGATRPGITLRIDAGPDSTITPGGAKWDTLSRAKKVPWVEDFLTGSRDAGYQLANFYTLLRTNFVPTGRMPLFHYAIAAAGIAPGDDTSGLTPGNKLGFMTTLGDWTGGKGSQNEQTGTFMHEFGHVLTLDHSGGEGDGDDVNRKPNFPSVMSYAYQTKGVFRNGVQVFDYSRDTMPDVDETTLTESGGVSLGLNPFAYGTTNSCGTKDAKGKLSFDTYIQAGLSPVNWNCDATTPNGATGFDGNGDTVKGTLKGSTSDWSRLQFKTGGLGSISGVVAIPGSGLSEPHHDVTFQESQSIRVLPLDTTLTYTGASSADYHDRATMSATLLDPGDGNSPIADKTIAFRIGSSSSDACSAQTDATGTASCAIKLTQAPGSYTVAASFAGDAIYKAATDGRAFTVTREETILTFTGPAVVLAGSTDASLSAKLVEDGDDGLAAPDPSGQTITFTLGSQSCSGTTDAAGVARCSLTGVSGAALGPKTLTAAFTGDAYYEPSSDSDEVIVFAFPAKGAFVLGDASVAAATAATPVTWWSDTWWLQDRVSGGIAPDSFKGFAASVTTLPTTTPANVCGTSFVTRTGNSPPPTSAVPSYMGVLVASSVAKAGTSVNGRWGKIVVVKTDPGYSPSPGHPGTGKIVATFCP